MMNKCRVRFSIPTRTIYGFQGEGMYEETLENDFRFIVCEELVKKNIDFDFDYYAFEVNNGFGMELKYQGDEIDLVAVVKKLLKNRFRLGLIVHKLENGNWIEIYNDSRRMKYKEFEINTK